MSSSRDFFAKFHNSVQNAISKELFRKQFYKLSFEGNRRGMIEMLMELPPVNDFVIQRNYLAKDDDLADNLYEKVCAISNQGEENQKIIFLTKALFASTLKSKIFLKILIELVRSWYKLGNFSKCLQYCKYLKNLENMLLHGDYCEEIKIEFLLIESECYKKLKLDEKSKIHLKEAMKSVNDFVQKKCIGEQDEIFRKKRVYFLNPIFERLNTMRKYTEENPIIENLENFIKHDINIPNVIGNPNKHLKACSNAISLGNNETKGRFLFATRSIKTGSVLIVDRPFAFSTDKEALERNCLNCHISLKLHDSIRVPCNECQTVSFCSEICRKESWEKYHKFECRIFNYFFNFERQKENQQKSSLLLAYRTTVSKALTESNTIDYEFLNYHSLDGKSEEASLKIGSEIYDPLDYKTVYSLETHCAETEPKENLLLALNSIFLIKLLKFVLRNTNAEYSIDQTQMILLAVGVFRHFQVIKCNAYEIVENVRKVESKIYEPRNIGGAIYTSVSLLNHSCYPNTVRHSYPRGIVVVTAIRPIAKGEEILDCYGPHFLKDDKNTRRETLKKKYYFICSCEACTFDWTIPTSDEVQFKCTCTNFKMTSTSQKCLKHNDKIGYKRIRRILEESKKKKCDALSKMYSGKHAEALPILLDHSNFVERNLLEPNLEAIKTQQSIIQCLNSMACISVQ